MFTVDDIIDLIAEGSSYDVEVNGKIIRDPDMLYDLGDEYVSEISAQKNGKGIPTIIITVEA